jgi:hypothetical protein
MTVAKYTTNGATYELYTEAALQQGFSDFLVLRTPNKVSSIHETLPKIVADKS